MSNYLEELQDARDNASNETEWKKCQEAIDTYFLGEPKKRTGKKQRKPKKQTYKNYPDDDDESYGWDDYDF